MSFWDVVLWCLIIISGLAALYGLHRLCLWLERRGWLFYKHKKPSSSEASCFVALQQVLEPPIQHVLHVKEEKRDHVEEGAPGKGAITCTSKYSHFWRRRRHLRNVSQIAPNSRKIHDFSQTKIVARNLLQMGTKVRKLLGISRVLSFFGFTLFVSTRRGSLVRIQ